MKEKLVSTAKPQLTCVLIGVILKLQDDTQAFEFLDELEFLARTVSKL